MVSSLPDRLLNQSQQARLPICHKRIEVVSPEQIDTRWASADAAAIRRHAAELVALAPDVILAHGGETVGPLLQATRTVPIVFPIVADPVGAGFVESLARPGGNATGFMNLEYGIGGKWLELLKEIAPSVTRAAIIRDTANPSGIAMFGIIQAMAPSLRMEVIPINIREASEFGPHWGSAIR
ncbi:MAG: ABC transporter substrate binding protein [Pseudolabrys sp.]